MAIEIIKDLVNESKYDIKCPYEMSPNWICVHNTANSASAKNEISYMKNNNYEVSYHFAVDDIEVRQGLPLNRNAWHAGDGNGEGNRQSIGIEICYSTLGGDKFAKAERNAARLIAQLLKEYGWDIDKVRTHQSFSGKNCPHLTIQLGWERFLNMVREEMNGVSNPSQPSINVLYRVKDKSGKQLGAYSVYANAEKMAKDNKALVYDVNGKVVADYSIVVTQPTPTPTPVKEKINVTYQVYGTKFYSEVVNLNDYAGVFNVPISCVKAKLSKGTIVYRVSPIGQNYYGWVRNYQYPEGAGIYNKCIDQFEAKLEGLSGYTVRYRVHTLKHGWLPWVQNGEMAGVRGFNIDALQIEVI